MNNNSANFIDEIAKAKIFQNFSKEELMNFLSSAKVHFFDKNKLIFMQNQKALHVNLVIRGSVKSTINDVDGNEIIAEIIFAKELINDVFLDSYSCNIVALEDVLILQIPIDIFRKKLENNAKFLYDFSYFNAKRNYKLMSHILSLKSNSAKEKLGNFILGMAFNNGEKQQNISLNFNKADIASFLDLQPETLSRNLKKLQDDGEIHVLSNQINLTDKRSLCKYCDEKIAKNCPDFELDGVLDEEFVDFSCKFKG